LNNVCYAFDIDGVIVDVTERLRVALEVSGGVKNRKFRDTFFDPDLIIRLDKPRPIGIELVRDRARKGCIIVITGRPRRLKDVSMEEFIKFTEVRPKAIFMRSNRDYRPSCIVKVELVEKALRLNYEIIELHDDDEEVLRSVKNTFPNIRLVHHLSNTYVIL